MKQAGQLQQRSNLNQRPAVAVLMPAQGVMCCDYLFEH